MGKFCILWDNKFDAATIAAGSAADGFPVANLQNGLRLKAHRTTGLSAEYVKANLLAPCAIDAFVSEYMNLSAAATLAIQGNGADSWGGPTLNDSIAVSAAMVAAGSGDSTTISGTPRLRADFIDTMILDSFRCAIGARFYRCDPVSVANTKPGYRLRLPR